MPRHLIIMVLCVLAVGCVTSREPVAQTSPAGIEASPELLFAARRAHFDYMAHLHRAESGERAALLALIELTPHISWAAASYEDHGDVLLALRSRLGAAAFREVFLRASPQARGQATNAMYAMNGYKTPLHLTEP